MQQLLESLRTSLPELTFTPGDKFYWSPETQEVFYKSMTGCAHGKAQHSRVQSGSNLSTAAERTTEVRGERSRGDEQMGSSVHRAAREDAKQMQRSAGVGPECADCAERNGWALLHETGHGVLGHTSYKTDVELLKMEIAAWEKAHELAAQHDITIDENHVQDCLDTYRDWLHARALCPSCTTRCLQNNSGHEYRCHNCHTSWKVTPSRFCRPYRSVSSTTQSATIFA